MTNRSHESRLVKVYYLGSMRSRDYPSCPSPETIAPVPCAPHVDIAVVLHPLSSSSLLSFRPSYKDILLGDLDITSHSTGLCLRLVRAVTPILSQGNSRAVIYPETSRREMSGGLI